MSIGSVTINPKSLMPEIKKKVIRRERLLDLLRGNIQTRFQAVSAPAGYGKSTLLANFAQAVGNPVCWYTFDTADEDPRVFFEGILASIRLRFPKMGKLTHIRLANTNDLSKDAVSLLNMLSAEIRADIPDSFIFVLDDFHFLHNSEPSKLLLNLFLERTPDNCHVIITSRTQVELPVILKTALQNPSILITTPQLSLTPDETLDLVKTQYGINLNTQEADELTQHAGGWIIGVLSGVHYLREQNITRKTATITRESISRYLTSEVYDKQSPEVQKFLLASSCLDDLSPEMCNHLCPFVNSRKLLRFIYRQNLFMQCIDESKQWYRYHQIFKDFLQAKLLEDDPELLRELHHRVGSLYEQNQQFNEAIKHYYIAKRYDESVRLIKSIGQDFSKSGRWTTISRWLDTIPDSLRLTDPEIIVLDASTMMHLGDPDKAIRILNTMTDRLSSTEDWLLKAKALSWRSAAFRLNGYFREARKDINTTIRLLEQNQGPPDLLGAAHRRLGDIHAEQGRFRPALRHFQRALRYYSSVMDIDEIALLHNSLGITYKRLGHLARAKMHFEKAKTGWTKANNPGALAIALNNIGLIYQRIGQYDLSLDALHSGLEKARETGYRRVEAGILISIADICRDMGLYQDAIPLYQQGLELSGQLMESSFMAYATAGIGETYRLQGDPAKAEMLLKEARHQAEEQEQFYEAALFSIPLGIIEYERGQFKKAEEILLNTTQKLKKMGDRDALAKACFHIAQVSFLCRKYDQAIEWLEKTSNLADELGYEEFLAIEGRCAVPLIQYGAENGIGDARFFRILEKIKIFNYNKPTGYITSIPNSVIEKIKPDIEANALTHTQLIINNQRINDNDWRSNRAKEIFFYLLTYRDGRTKEQIIAALWPDLPLDKGTRNLHTNLFRARRALYPGIFMLEDRRYKINPNLRIWYDVTEFENLLSIAEVSTSSNAERVSALEQALNLYGGTFLTELYNEWIETIRRELENKYLRALSLLADHYATTGNYNRAVTLLEKYVAVDPYAEDAYFRIMSWYSAEQNPALALRTYKQYMKFASNESDTKSSHEIRELYKNIITRSSIKYIQN